VSTGARYLLRLAGCLLLISGALGGAALPAGAVILPATTLDGPSQDIVGFGGVAMAEDGTGGVVYLKREAGVVHVFVARYREGHWLAPMRVDSGEQFAASTPRIGAANGGELVVVWATPFASEHAKPVYELLGSTLGPGSERFAPAQIVDRDIREGANAEPDLAMSSTAQADVVYRVVESSEENRGVRLLHPGDVVEQVRVAHFNGEKWTALGAINRNPGIGMRPASPANAPAIAIGRTGNAVVVWQEPEIEGTARIWARRIFGRNVNYVMPVSASTFAGRPIAIDADAPAVALSFLGQAEVAYRQQTGPGSPLPGPRIFLNILPDGESHAGAEFSGPVIADNAVPNCEKCVGLPSIDIDEKQNMRLLYYDNGKARVIDGTDKGLVGSLSLGPAFVGNALAEADELPSASVMNPSGGGVSAWPSEDAHGHPAVAVREDFPEGGVQTAIVGGGAGGPIGALSVGRSGLGDGLVAFQQGPLGNAAIVATQVTTPPASFPVSVPNGIVKPAAAIVTWAPAPSANGPLSYTVVLDGRALPTPQGTQSLRLSPIGLGGGVHDVQVLATDIFGQATLTAPTQITIAGPPTVAVTASRRLSVTVRVTDPGIGVRAARVHVSFGDGARAAGRTVLRHSYRRPGTYTIVVRAADRLGEAGVVRKRVHVR
jgi:PKD domain